MSEEKKENGEMRNNDRQMKEKCWRNKTKNGRKMKMKKKMNNEKEKEVEWKGKKK